MANPGHHAANRPDDPALIIADTGETLTWAGLHNMAVAAANHLHDLGLRPGDPVAFCLENRFEFAAMVWAAQYSGLRYTPISSRLTRDEIAYMVADCETTVLIHSNETAVAGEATAGAGRAVRVVDVDVPGAIAWHQGAAQARFDRVEGITMLYSSGTTGRPKGVRRPAPPEPIEELPPGDRMLASAYGIDPASVYLSTAPLYHSAPLTFLLQMGRIGATTVVMRRFDAVGALDAIERYRVTHSQWVPTMFVRMLALPEADRNGRDLSSHVFAIHGAGPCPVHVKEAMLDWWGPIVHEYYAGTEGAGMCVIGPDEWLAHKGSVGRSIRGPVQILDDDGRPLEPGQIGQIWFANSADFSYHGDGSKTAGARGPDGSGTFGDIGYVDEDGYLYLTDRKSFTINAGGINIYPREVEEVLMKHPAVFDVAVFGIPNAEYGDEVKAVVQPATGWQASDDLAVQLVEHCRTQLASFKLPRSIDFIDELPREPTGKLRVAQLRAQYTDLR